MLVGVSFGRVNGEMEFATFFTVFARKTAEKAGSSRPGSTCLARCGAVWRGEHGYPIGAGRTFRLCGAPPSPFRSDAIAPKPKAKAEKRRFGATAAVRRKVGKGRNLEIPKRRSAVALVLRDKSRAPSLPHRNTSMPGRTAGFDKSVFFSYLLLGD